MKIVDIHVHIGDLEEKKNSSQYYDKYLPDIINYMDSNSISRCVLQSNAAEGFRIQEMEMFYDISMKYPDKFSWMIGIDSSTPTNQIYTLLAKQKELGACGVGEIVNHTPFTSAFADTIFSCAEALDLPVLFHMSSSLDFGYGLYDLPNLPLLETVLQKYPNLKIIGHSQPFWREISGDCPLDPKGRNTWGQGPVIPNGTLIRLLEQYPNLYCDLSANSGGCAIMRDLEFGLSFIKKNSSRLLFGSDIIGNKKRYPLLSWMIDQSKSGKISDESLEKILLTNACRLLNLDIK